MHFLLFSEVDLQNLHSFVGLKKKKVLCAVVDIAQPKTAFIEQVLKSSHVNRLKTFMGVLKLNLMLLSLLRLRKHMD